MSAQVRLATMGQLKGARPVDHIKDHLRQACGLENLPYVNKLICSTWAFSNTAYQVVAMRIGKLKESEDHGVFAVCFPYAQDTSDSDRQLRFYQKMGHKKTEMNKSQMGSVDYLTPFCWIFEGINENAVECLRAFLQTWFVLRNYTKIDPVIDFELLARSATIIQDKRGTPNHSKDDADCAGGLAPRPLTEDHERQHPDNSHRQPSAKRIGTPIIRASVKKLRMLSSPQIDPGRSNLSPDTSHDAADAHGADNYTSNTVNERNPGSTRPSESIMDTPTDTIARASNLEVSLDADQEGHTVLNGDMSPLTCSRTACTKDRNASKGQEQRGFADIPTPDRSRSPEARVDTFDAWVREECGQFGQDHVDAYLTTKCNIANRRRSITRHARNLATYRTNEAAIRDQIEAVATAAHAKARERDAQDLEASRSCFATIRNPTRQQRIACFEAAIARERNGEQEAARIENDARTEQACLEMAKTQLKAQVRAKSLKLQGKERELAVEKEKQKAMRDDGGWELAFAVGYAMAEEHRRKRLE